MPEQIESIYIKIAELLLEKIAAKKKKSTDMGLGIKSPNSLGPDQPLKITKDRQAKEVQLWQNWMDNPNNKTLKPLLKSLNPVIDHHTNKMTGNLPRSAIKAEMTRLVVDYLPGYDPSKSQLNTYLFNTAGQKLNRYVYNHQNLGTIPEPRIIMIGRLNKVKTNLENELGREPTYTEIADEMKVPVDQIQLLEKELRPDLVIDGRYTNMFGDNDATHVDDSIAMLHASVDGNEKQVLEYVYGLDGKPQLSNKEIANKLSISPGRVVQIKDNLATSW